MSPKGQLGEIKLSAGSNRKLLKGLFTINSRTKNMNRMQTENFTFKVLKVKCIDRIMFVL